MKTVSNIIKSLLIKEPYYGMFACGLKKEFTKDPNFPTAGVALDGINYKLLINEDWWHKLPPNIQYGIIKHEMLHLVFYHVVDYSQWLELAERDVELLNVAMDLEIQSFIDPEFRWAECDAEKIFKDFPNLPRKMGTKFYIEFLNQLKKYKSGNPPKTQAFAGCSPEQMLQGQRDLQNANNKGSHSQWSTDKISDTKKELIKNQLDYQCKEVAKNTSKSRGLWPAELTAMLEKLLTPLPPIFNWKAYFRRLLGVAFDIYQKKTRRKESLRFPDSPGLKKRKKHKILVAIDTSGSVNNEELQEFFNEIRFIWKAGADVHVLECDAKINKEWDYKGTPPDKITGRGGTSFIPCVDYYNQHRKEYTTMVYFTDGYGDQKQCKPLNKMLWIITSDGAQSDNNFPGIKICIPKKRKEK